MLSGNYLTTYSEYCQPSLSIVYTGGKVTQVNVNSAGSITNSVVVANFNPNTCTLQITGQQNNGSDLLLSDNIGNNFGTPFATSPVSQSDPYSNTATTVTIAGNVYQAIYEPQKKGIASSVALVGNNSVGCADVINGTRQ